MATYIKGNAVANATSYDLCEKSGSGTYTTLATKNEIIFELDTLNLVSGNHTLVVKAKADGYEDSDYSNEVTYTVASAPAQPADELAGTWLLNETINVSGFGGKDKNGGLGITYANYRGYKLNYSVASLSPMYLVGHTSAQLLSYDLDGSAAQTLYFDKWSNAEYRTITITSTLAEVDGGATLLAWLNANGVKQS